MKTLVSIYAGLFTILISSVNGAIITSAGDPALSGATVDDFSSYATGDPASVSDGIFTMTEISSDPSPYLSVRDNFNGSYGIVGRSVVNYTKNPINITFEVPVSAFGIHIGAADVNFVWTLEAFDSLGASLGSGMVTVDSNKNANGFFLGWSDTSIGSVALTPSAPDTAIFDNLSYVVVPEPATSALLFGLAAGALLCFRRFRRDRVA